jgi:hypothetical protein
MNTPGVDEHQRQNIETQSGFIAVLHQSGGSTPNASRWKPD